MYQFLLFYDSIKYAFGMAAFKSLALILLERFVLSAVHGPFPRITCRFTLRDQLIRYHYQFPPMIVFLKAALLALVASCTDYWTSDTTAPSALARACSTMASVYILRVFLLSSFTSTPFGPNPLLSVFLTSLSHFLGTLVPELTQITPFVTLYDDLVRHVLWAALAALCICS
jgi:hypothetical protein